jgi:ABC-type dipeptide/oligopeptide/nickel transport system permease subunit
VAIAIVYVPIFIRVTRGPVLSLREIEYVTAATSTGQSRTMVMLRHVLPNITSIIIIQVTLSLSWAVLTEASLSFLGLGAQPPTPEGGVIISDGRDKLRTAWWISTFAGGAIMISVLAINLVGDALRDALDAWLATRRAETGTHETSLSGGADSTGSSTSGDDPAGQTLEMDALSDDTGTGTGTGAGGGRR